jgi:glutaryl-CoA dehydrogenase
VDYFYLDDLLSDEEKGIRNMVRGFMEKEVEPFIADVFHREKPLNMRELGPKMGELGIIGPFIPKEYGGAGTNYVSFGLVFQELERVDSAVRSFVAVQSALAMYPIWKFGSEEQKRRWLPLITKGEKIGCFGLTEPNHGSDVASMETTTRQHNHSWIINGTKQWISDASTADLAIVWAKTDEGIRGFLVERGTPGFSQSFQNRKGSMRASDVSELTLQDGERSELLWIATKKLWNIPRKGSNSVRR